VPDAFRLIGAMNAIKRVYLAPHSHPFQSEQFCSVTVIDGAYISSWASVRVAGKNGDLPMVLLNHPRKPD